MGFWPRKFSRSKDQQNNNVATYAHQEATGLTQSSFNSTNSGSSVHEAPSTGSDKLNQTSQIMTNTFASASDAFSKVVDHNIHPVVSYNQASEEQTAGSHMTADTFEPTSSSDTHSSILNNESIDANMRLSQSVSNAVNTFPHQINPIVDTNEVTVAEDTHQQLDLPAPTKPAANEFEHSPMSSQDFPEAHIDPEESGQPGSYNQSEIAAKALNLPVKRHVEFTRPEQNSPPSLNTTGDSTDPFTRAAVHESASLAPG